MEQVLTVSQLTGLLKQHIENSFYSLTLEGEISGFKAAPTGHWYFSLKDDDCVISACLWKNTVWKVGFVPKNGDKVTVTGSVSVYGPRGTYSFNCTSMRKSGLGDILVRLEERKRYYQGLGYFDESLKKPIPKRPSKVAVITSPTGAALQDILQITGRRAGGMDILIVPALVQGEEAATCIAKRIRQVSDLHLADVVIVGRGGGSVEDLLPFSESCVIEAIHDCEIPVISAVGHEIDWAISDFVADLRAPTPSAAAELVCENAQDRLQMLENFRSSMKEIMRTRISDARLRLSCFSEKAVRRDIEARLGSMHMSLDSLMMQMQGSISLRINEMKTRLEVARSTIRALSPQSVLDRGYAIVTDRDGSVVRNTSALSKGDIIKVTVSDGGFEASVSEVCNER